MTTFDGPIGEYPYMDCILGLPPIPQTRLVDLFAKYGYDYDPVYEALLEPIRDMPVTLLDLGGHAPHAWHDYFRHGQIHVLSCAPSTIDTDGYPRLHCWIGDRNDQDFLEHWHRHVGNFDVIIDAHSIDGTMDATSDLWLWLNPASWYIAEDMHLRRHL